MSTEFLATIESLKKVLSGYEQKVIETKTTINNLSALSGLEPPFPNVGQAAQASITAIKGDTFYGKTVIVAAREYLDMRKASNLGPAPVKEIFEALKRGGFIFGSKSEGNSQIVLRNALSKASAVFHKLPTGEYGLAKWYDLKKIKKTKNDNNETEEDTDVAEEEPTNE